MQKKVLALSLTLMLVGGVAAQQASNNALHGLKGGNGAKTITFSASDIQYWVGTGNNSAVVVIAWDDYTTPTAYAWGVHWNGNVSALDLIDSIQTHDSRFHNGSSATVASATYTENGVTLTSSANYWCYTVNGDWATVGYSGYTMSDGDIMELSGSCYFDMTTAVAATNPNGSSDDTPEDATLDVSDILYWVGEGSNKVVMAVNWADTALAWGYRFNTESVSVVTMMDDIAAADPRFSYSMNGSFLSDINFISGSDTLGVTAGNFWWSLQNHVASMGMRDTLHDGDFYKWGDLSVAVVTDSTWMSDWNYWNYTNVWPYTIYPVSIPPIADASFAATDILYWVGEGDNEIVMAVNWADTALAWGYRFNGESVSIVTVMDDIAAADPRFSYSMNGSFLSDINFISGSDTLGVTAGNFWWSLQNHIASMGMGDTLHDGDFYKWGDLSVAVVTDSTWMSDWNYWNYTNVWPYTIYPVSVPSTTPEEGPFCGAAGTAGSSAIAYNDSRIKAWATGCTIVRGSQNLSDPDAAVVTYGTENEAIGAASSNTTDVVSLGDGGSATLTFATPIKNGDGYDFAVFENSFSDSFLELAFVEVSSDGVNFVRFPATSLTQTNVQIGGNGPVDPTFINNLAGKYRAGYGTPFDLEELRDSTNVDINHITHIRVVDVVGSIDPQYGTYDAFGHIINDPFPTISYSAGFDLDGIGVLNPASSGIDDSEAAQFRAYPNPAVDIINVVYTGAADAAVVRLYDMTGREVISSVIANGCTIQIATSQLPNGIYMLRVNEEVEKIVVRH